MCFKLHGAQYCNTAAFERSMAKTLLNTQLHFLQQDTSFMEGDFLVRGKEDNTYLSKWLADVGDEVFISTRVVHGEVRFAAGDVVICKGDAASHC